MIICLPNDTETKIDYKSLTSLGRVIHNISHLLFGKNIPDEEVLVFISTRFDVTMLRRVVQLRDYKFTFVIKNPEFKHFYENYGEVIEVNYRVLNYTIVRDIIYNSTEDIKKLNQRNISKPNTDLEFMKHLEESTVPREIDFYNYVKTLSEVNKVYENKESNFISTIESLNVEIRKLQHTQESVIEFNTDLQRINSSLVKRINLVEDVVYSNNIYTLPDDITSIYIKNYNAVFAHQFAEGLYFNLDVNRGIYTKVIYLFKPTEVNMLTLPDKYLLITEETDLSEILESNFLALTGDISFNLRELLSLDSCRNFIIVDDTQELKDSVMRYTFKVNLLPNMDTVYKLNLQDSYYITNSKSSERVLLEVKNSKKTNYKLSQVKEVADVANIFIELLEEVY